MRTLKVFGIGAVKKDVFLAAELEAFLQANTKAKYSEDNPATRFYYGVDLVGGFYFDFWAPWKYTNPEAKMAHWQYVAWTLAPAAVQFIWKMSYAQAIEYLANMTSCDKEHRQPQYKKILREYEKAQAKVAKALRVKLQKEGTMPEHPFISGYIKDTEDKKDFPATRLLAREVALPEDYIDNPGTIIYDQNGYPKCVAHGADGCKTDEEFLQTGRQIKFDPNWLYKLCKERDGIPDQDGTYPRVALKILNQIGCKTASVSTICPFRFLKPKPPEPTPDDIYKYRIAAYYRIEPTSTDEFIKQIIYQFGSILVGSSWYSNWMLKFSVFPTPNNIVVGGHAYRIIGWNTVGFIVANSWGKILWGVNGIATMPYTIFKGILAEGDCWKLVDHIPESLQN